MFQILNLFCTIQLLPPDKANCIALVASGKAAPNDSDPLAPQPASGQSLVRIPIEDLQDTPEDRKTG